MFWQITQLFCLFGTFPQIMFFFVSKCLSYCSTSKGEELRKLIGAPAYQMQFKNTTGIDFFFLEQFYVWIRRMTQRWEYRTNLSTYKFLICLSFLVVIPLLWSDDKRFLCESILLQEIAMSNAWYEVLSVLHLMAILSLS